VADSWRENDAGTQNEMDQWKTLEEVQNMLAKESGSYSSYLLEEAAGVY
jgi:hypothetical protein